MAEEIAIKVENISKTFKLPHEKNASIKSAIVNIGKREKGYEIQQALKDISFEVKKGEFFGIVGRNGSGKSTLLKLISEIYTPDSGKITVNGKLTPFIELGVGFNPELSGRDNVFLNGALLGFSRSEVEDLYDEIVSFAELERFMDQKLKNYSSGMQVRLAFSIAIQANSGILVLDEVLAVGDYNFQQKCYEYFKKLKSENKTVVLVSHDSSALQMFCTKAILIENGVIKKSGEISDVLKAYAEQNQSDAEKKKSSTNESTVEKDVSGVTLLESYVTVDGKNTKSIGPNKVMNINFEVKFSEDIDNPVFGLNIHSAEGGAPIFATNTLDMKKKTGIFKKGETKKLTFIVENVFDDGKYTISGAVASKNRSLLYTRYINVISFSSIGWLKTAKSKVYLSHKFESSNTGL